MSRNFGCLKFIFFQYISIPLLQNASKKSPAKNFTFLVSLSIKVLNSQNIKNIKNQKITLCNKSSI